MTTNGTNVPRQFTGRRMLAVMIGFFGVVIAVNVALAVLASTSWSGLVVENSYVASQHFNEDLAQAHRQQALGWRSTMSYAGGGLHFDLTDRDGVPLPGMTVEATLRRPTHEGEDRHVVLTSSTGGGYGVALDLQKGAWNADVAAVDTLGRHYQRAFRLWAGE